MIVCKENESGCNKSDQTVVCGSVHFVHEMDTDLPIIKIVGAFACMVTAQLYNVNEKEQPKRGPQCQFHRPTLQSAVGGPVFDDMEHPCHRKEALILQTNRQK